MTSSDIFARRESAVRSYCRSFPATFKTAREAILWDDEGRAYIDFFAGAGALNYGHNPPALKDALIAYIRGDGIAHSLDLHTTAKAAFLEEFSDAILVPRNLDYRVLFCGPTGTNAIEAALKLARKITRRSNVAAFTNGFHGMSTGALAATGSKFHRNGAGVALNNIDRYPYHGYFGAADTVAMIRKLLEDPSSGLEPPAAFLLETIQAEGGLRCASAAWLRDLAALAAELGSLIIVDDIQAGCGRCGTFFSFEDAGIRPDIVCLSKSIGGFGLPMSLVLFDQRHDVWKPGEHNGTFRGNNLAFVTAATALAFWRDPSFVEALTQRGAQLEDGLAKLVQEIGDPSFSSRGRGVMHGLVCPDGEIAGAISRKAFEGGLLVETCGPHDEVVKCLPPITISQEHLAEGLARLSEAALAVLYERTPIQTRYAAE